MRNISSITLVPYMFCCMAVGWQEQHAHEPFLSTGFLANISNMGYIDLLDRASGFKVCCNIRIFRFIQILLFLLTSLYVCDTTRQQSPELILNECVRVGRTVLQQQQKQKQKQKQNNYVNI